MIASAFLIALVGAFDAMRRMLNRPMLYAVPYQDVDGATYDADVDAWIDGDGDVVTKSPSELTYYAVPALWGPDAEQLVLGLGGMSYTGDLVAIAEADQVGYFDNNLMVATGSLDGDTYTITGLDDAPDGNAAIFVVVDLQRRER